jgi:hypothetical protein
MLLVLEYHGPGDNYMSYGGEEICVDLIISEGRVARGHDLEGSLGLMG